MINFIKMLSIITFCIAIQISPVHSLCAKCILKCNEPVNLPEIWLGPKTPIKINPFEGGQKLRWNFSFLDKLTRPDMPNIVKFAVESGSGLKNFLDGLGSPNSSTNSNFGDSNNPDNLIGANNQERLGLYNLAFIKGEDGGYRMMFRNEAALKSDELEKRIDKFNELCDMYRQTENRPIEFMNTTFQGDEKTITLADLKIESGYINNNIIENGLLWVGIPIFAYRSKENYEKLKEKLEIYQRNLKELFKIDYSISIKRLIDRFLLSSIKFNFANRDKYEFRVFYGDRGLLGIRDSRSLRIKYWKKGEWTKDSPSFFVVFNDKEGSNELRKPPAQALNSASKEIDFEITKRGELEFDFKTRSNGYDRIFKNPDDLDSLL